MFHFFGILVNVWFAILDAKITRLQKGPGGTESTLIYGVSGRSKVQRYKCTKCSFSSEAEFYAILARQEK